MSSRSTLVGSLCLSLFLAACSAPMTNNGGTGGGATAGGRVTGGGGGTGGGATGGGDMSGGGTSGGGTSGGGTSGGGTGGGASGGGTGGGAGLPSTKAVRIAAGDAFACAVTMAGSVRCWGYRGDPTNSFLPRAWSTFGSPTFTDNQLSPVEVPGITDATDIVASSDHVCVLTRGKQVKCWGQNDSGQIGDGSNDGVTSVKTVPLTNVKKIAVANSGSCALLEDGTVRCWGERASSQGGWLFEGLSVTEAQSRSPVTIPFAQGATDLTMGSKGICALLSGTWRCWGDPILMAGGSSSDAPPRAIPLSNMTRLLPGTVIFVSCGIIAGAAKCWGNPDEGWLGDGTSSADTVDPAVPRQVTGLDVGVTDLIFGGAIKAGKVFRWSDRNRGVNNPASTSTLPVEVAVPGTSVQVSGIPNVDGPICALNSLGQVYCWGDNGRGSLGDGTRNNSPTPIKVLWFD